MFNRNTLIILALAAAVAGLFAGLKVFAPKEPAACPPLEVAKCFETPRPLPPFELIASDGRALTGNDLAGRWTVVFIGFVHCPDVCPSTLAQLRQAQKQWEALPEASRPRLLFVSVDPERDTPELVGRYARGFHPDTLAATGTLPALEAFSRSLSLVFMKQPPSDPSRPEHYAVDHSATLALIDPQLRMAGVIQPDPESHGFAADKLARDLATLARTRP